MKIDPADAGPSLTADPADAGPSLTAEPTRYFLSCSSPDV